MVYKNLLFRLCFSLFFFLLYLIASIDKHLLFLFGTLIYLLVFYEVLIFFKKSYKLILLYLILSYVFFALYFFAYFEFLIFNLFIFTIIFFDSFSFFTGKIIGKTFIFKLISPKKTLEGYLGGIFFTNLFLIIYINFITIELDIFKLITLLNLTIFISIIGDLIESYFKRINAIKDSSKYLPGHGGFFDRFDSFIASIIMLTLFSSMSL